MKSESEIQKEIIDYLKARGYLVFRMNAGKAKNNMRLCPPGTPDLLALSYHGEYLWIEVKTGTGKLSEIQKVMHSDIIMKGGSVIVARSVEDLKLPV